jgi:predicted  nucleic acid-binding Zn-ribbon protein
MRAEKSKVYSLRSAQSALGTELRTSKAQEQEHRRDLLVANETTTQLKRAHAKEVGELQDARWKAEREVKALKEDLTVLKAELGDERATCTALKVRSPPLSGRLVLEIRVDARSLLIGRAFKTRNEALQPGDAAQRLAISDA